MLERNATEVDLAGLESDIELSEAQGAEGTLGVKERSALVVEREAERADAHVRGHWARHEALARARREAEREAEALR